jgi:hypothetical protein
MTKLNTPKIDTNQRDIIRKFQEVCVGLTILASYAILWLLIAALGYRIYLWLF